MWSLAKNNCHLWVILCAKPGRSLQEVKFKSQTLWNISENVLTVRWEEKVKKQRKYTWIECHFSFFPLKWLQTNYLNTRRRAQVVTGAYGVKGLWLRYHVAGFCCCWGFKRTPSPCWSPSSGLSWDLFLFLNYCVHLLSRRLCYTLTSRLRYYCMLKRALQLPAWSHARNLGLEITLTCEFYSGALPVVISMGLYLWGQYNVSLWNL